MRNSELRPLRLLRWWAAALGAAAVAVATAATTLWLLSIAARSAPLRLEAIKIGLSVGAGVGASFALMLAFRRQWLSERGQTHVEDVARANAYDATQRRITELYGRAVEQLGHQKAAVRLGGLYSLERLAQEEPEHRQTVVDVVCAYLRMPFESSSVTSSSPLREEDARAPDRILQGDRENVSAGNEGKGELQVRQAAQRLLARHLTMPSRDSRLGVHLESPQNYWPGIRIDLFGALLVDFDFSRCLLHEADFRRARFNGNAAFQGACFDVAVSFLGAEFEREAWFQESEFSTHAGFYKVTFGHDAWFQGARFNGTASFRETEFGRLAGFGSAKFGGNVTFERSIFKGDAGFRDVQFDERSGFRRTDFRQAAVFRTVKFGGESRFDSAEFAGDARFNQARWVQAASFASALFRRQAGFQGARFEGTSSFEGAQFEVAPKFGRASASVFTKHTWPVGWRAVQPSESDTTMMKVIHEPGSLKDVIPRQASGTESVTAQLDGPGKLDEEKSKGTV